MRIVAEILIVLGGYVWAFSTPDPLGWLVALAVAFCPLQIGLIVYYYNGLFVSDFFLLGALFLFLASSRERLRWSPRGLGIPFVLFLAWLLISSLVAQYPSSRSVALSEWTRFLRGYLMFVVVFSASLQPARFRRILWALVAGVFWEGFVAFLQWRRGYAGLAFLGEQRIAWRATGLFAHPTMFGEYVAMLAPLTVRLLVTHPFRPPWKRGLFTAGFLIVLGGLLGSYARAGWLGTGMGVVVAFGLPLLKMRAKLIARYKGPLIVLVLIGALGIVRYAPVLQKQFTDPARKRSANVRKPLSWVAMEMSKDRALFGVGLGNYRNNSWRYVPKVYPRAEAIGFDSWDELMQVVHNSYLLLSSEGGAFALLCFVLMILWLLRDAFLLGWRATGLIQNIGLGALGGLFAFSVVMFASPNMYQEPFLMCFWALAGL
ncbi:MAG: O-antigen ligase family protein, partial [candidate division KSB1 bacterium]|nr:O-antigen ligase family protein [candidate division KSB1 bacterium]